MWAFGQKNIPNGKQNFVFKEAGPNGLRRLFYVGHCSDNVLYNITVLDMAKKDTMQVLQAKQGGTSPDGWEFNKGAIYTISERGDILNTTFFEHSIAQFGMDLSRELNKNIAQEQNFLQLVKYLAADSSLDKEQLNELRIDLYDKIALPITTIVFVLVGVPLAITPPRVRYNRGFLFSILIIFFYYLIRALSMSFGVTGALTPFLAAWLPNIILVIVGLMLYYRKVYTIA